MPYTKTNTIDDRTKQSILDEVSIGLNPDNWNEVTLDTGQVVLCSCVPCPQTDFGFMAKAFQVKDGQVRFNKQGTLVMTEFRHNFDAISLRRLTVKTARKACLMIVLGEKQPQVDIPNPDENGALQEDAIPLPDPQEFSIRTAIAAAGLIDEPLTDVL